MSPEQQRIAIAEACGWKSIGEQYWLKVDVASGGKQYASHITHLPDYLTDLNAMHEAEKVLFTNDNTLQKKWIRYTAIIYDITVMPLHATARQRAEAFLRTIGRWTEPVPDAPATSSGNEEKKKDLV